MPTILLVALAAPAVVALRAQSEDRLVRPEAAAADPCACLTWRKVYSEQNGTCGAGRELSATSEDQSTNVPGKWYTPEQYKGFFGKEVEWEAPSQWWEGKDTVFVAKDDTTGFPRGDDCNTFFKMSNHNYCVNWNYNSAETPAEQWCYVSSQCTTLGKGKTVSDKLSYKTCTSTDTKLADKGTFELQQLAVENNLDLVTLAKWAYVCPGNLSQITDDYKRVAKKSGLKHFYNSDTGAAPFYVGEGNGTVKRINFRRPEAKGMLMWFDNELTQVECTEECSDMGFLSR